MPSRAKDWLRQSERNLKSAQLNYEAGLYEETCYESQQAAEKAIKGLLNYMHKELKGHSITILLKSLNIDIPEDILICAQELDKQYIPSRYLDAYDEGAPLDYYNKLDAEKCINCAKSILTWVKNNVGNL